MELKFNHIRWTMVSQKYCFVRLCLLHDCSRKFSLLKYGSVDIIVLFLLLGNLLHTLGELYPKQEPIPIGNSELAYQKDH